MLRNVNNVEQKVCSLPIQNGTVKFIKYLTLDSSEYPVPTKVNFKSMRLLHACAYVCANIHIYMHRVIPIGAATR